VDEPSKPAKEGMMDISIFDPVERLIAEAAVLGHREVMKAMKSAPHGQGLAVTERAVLDRGRQQMVLCLEEALRAKAAEEKGGRAVRASGGRRSGIASPSTS